MSPKQRLWRIGAVVLGAIATAAATLSQCSAEHACPSHVVVSTWPVFECLTLPTPTKAPVK